MKAKMLFLSLSILLSASIMAQEKKRALGFEFNTGLSLPAGTLSESKLNPGFGFEGILFYPVLHGTSIYAGWGWNRMGADQSFAGDDVCFEETGYIFGLQYKGELSLLPINYFIRAGGLYNHVETENHEGDIIIDTGHGFGGQLAGGISLPIGQKWSLTPGVKFNILSRDADYEGIKRQMSYKYFSIRVGFTRCL